MVRRDLLEGNQLESLRDMRETKTFPFAAQPWGLHADGGTSALGGGHLLLPGLFPHEERQETASRTQDALARTALPQEALFQALRKTEIVSKSLDLTVRNRFSEAPYSRLRTLITDISKHLSVLPTYLLLSPPH